MKNLWIAVVMLLLLTTCTQLEPDLSGIGEVKFQSVLVDSFSGNLPNGRLAGPSTWKHIFKNPAVMEIKNKVTGEEFKFDYNPNEFGEGIKFPLPYGSYTYKTSVSGGAFEKYLPFKAEGEFNLGVASLEVKIQATTDYGLITVKNEYVKSISIRYGSETCEFKLLPDKSFYFIYAKKGQTAKLEIIESLSDKLIKRDVPISAYNHYNFFLKKAELNGSVNFIELALGVFEYVDEGIEIGESDSETFSDPRDGQVYKIVKIGDQVWFAENLNYNAEGSWCYDSDSENCEIYGRLYSWEVGLTACPEGWHLPSEDEWNNLIEFLGGYEIAGGKMKAISGWDEPNIGATNESGFSALPGGGSNVLTGGAGLWWSSTGFGVLDAEWYEVPTLSLYSGTQGAYLNLERSLYNRFSCRCVKN
ncbi:fibrobacter succinogenes major paralogous domain-containing protein [Cognataquiflexum aquatile]|uniref:fibrobacter succinogenes major paralogous domain-containing protein n=1 Tax=Cognataquiflexum aquatile TaxID=2249427 RepID=UPI000DE8D8AB|nr:fibrobacter succinogenes major paralogous domain-containing protein [Cognataquiflexum aquatile]